MELIRKEFVENSRTRGLRRGGPGRRKGVPNKATREVRTLARGLLNDKRYLAQLRRRMIAGTAGPVEVLLYHYAYGKPKDMSEHLDVDPSSWTDEQLDAYDRGAPLALVLAMAMYRCPRCGWGNENNRTP